ncbi:MAG: radical SAM family heme chaperone HemW [Oscillospiraceae bacterium]|nr:radical SAM family heme chaperone HemW [Oscillospiraceae bacterium]
MKPKPVMPALGIYIHIPFCRSKCDYCDFYSLACGDKNVMDRYQRALLAHVEELAPRAENHVVDSVYIGGGTPSYYGADRIKALLKLIRKKYRLSRDCEITMEANPDSIDRKAFAHLRRAGVNRFSLGVQSASDRELKEVGRPHSFQQVREAVEAARKAKVSNLSLDLIYGLPGQDMHSWRDTVEQALALSPEHLSCYGLKVEEGTPLWRRRETEDLPDGDTQADMYLWAVDRLAQAGYRQYEISNFAKPGMESRHNLKYWMTEEYIGFGPAAHSDFGGWRYSFVRSIDRYVDGVLSGGSIVAESEQIPHRGRSAEYLMLRLRTSRGVEEAEYRREFQMNFDPLAVRLKEYWKQGWAEQVEGRWRLTPKGFLVSNQLIGELMDIQEAATLEGTLEYTQKLERRRTDLRKE